MSPEEYASLVNLGPYAPAPEPNMSMVPMGPPAPPPPDLPPDNNMSTREIASSAPPEAPPGMSVAPPPAPPSGPGARPYIDAISKGVGFANDAMGLANPVTAAATGARMLAGQSGHGAPPPAPPGKDPSNVAVMPTGDNTSAPPPHEIDTRAEPETTPRPPAYPPQVVIPGGFRSRIRPEDWANLSAARQEEIIAADNIHTREGNEALAEKLAGEKKLSGVEIEELDSRIERDKLGHRLETLDKRGSELDKDGKDLANYHEDPSRFWESRSTFQKVMGSIGIALGGFVSGARGGPNSALDNINRAIDQDIAAQRNTYLAKKDSLAAKKSAYGMAMERYNHDDDKAQAVVKIAALHRTAAEASILAATHKGTEVEDRHNTFQAKLSRQIANEGISYYEKYDARVVGGSGLTTEQRLKHDEKLVDQEIERSKVKASQATHQAEAEQKADDKAEHGTEFIARERATQKLADAENSNAAVSKVLAQKDPAGVGMFKQHLPSWMLTDEGSNNRSAIQAQGNSYALRHAGQAQNAAETARMVKVTTGRGTKEDIAWFNDFMHEDAAAQDRSIKAGASPEAVRRYEERNPPPRKPSTEPETPRAKKVK